MPRDEVLGFLDLPLVATLTTLGRDGWPHSTGMWFVRFEDEIRMWTFAKSQKATNLRRDPRAAFMVEEGSEYGELRGVLVRAEVRTVTDFEAVAAVGRALYERYSQPYTGIPYEGVPQAEVERQAVKRVALVLPLTRVASWDHRRL